MIVVDLLKVANDGAKISASVQTSVGFTITSATYWDSATYKNYGEGIDLTSLLTQSGNVEIFDILPTDVGGTEFVADIFFVEFTTDDTTPPSNCPSCNGVKALGVTASLTKYEECILEKVLKVSSCSGDIFMETGCEDSSVNSIINTKVVLDSLKYALQAGYYTEAITFKKQLDKFCTTDCYNCDDLGPTVYLAGLNFCTVDDNLILQ